MQGPLNTPSMGFTLSAPDVSRPIETQPDRLFWDILFGMRTHDFWTYLAKVKLNKSGILSSRGNRAVDHNVGKRASRRMG